MNPISLTGDFTYNDLNVKDPIITLTQLKYNFDAMTVVISIRMKNSANTYFHERELPPISFEENLTNSEIEYYITEALNERLKAPPASNGYAIVIPTNLQEFFPVKIEGYVIPMFEHNGQQVVEASYLQWKPAFDTFDKQVHSDYKEALYKIFLYAKGPNAQVIQL